MLKKEWTVWVGGSEINNYLLTKQEALNLALEYEDYNDVIIQNVKTGEIISYMSFENFGIKLDEIDFSYSTNDFWDFKEYYQNLAGFEENFKDFKEFILNKKRG